MDSPEENIAPKKDPASEDRNWMVRRRRLRGQLGYEACYGLAEKSRQNQHKH
ncbi:UNVERIFIED_CONTAM: hypothetical protein Sradi_2548300 [Sesamum radiatum]|uniref:Uncharacterized protein n=1 Tax=Sesamum radiatum TaxID=300843 RepID=A0AAW2SME7_SESRA